MTDSKTADEAKATVLDDSAVTELSKQLPTFSDLLPQQAQPYWQAVQTYPIIEALLILAIFWGLAMFIRRYAITLIKRLTSKTVTDIDDQIIESLRKPIFNAVLWFGLIVASKSAGFVNGVAAYITPISLSMIVLAMLRLALSISSTLINASAHGNARFLKMDIRTAPLAIIASKIVILLIGAYIVLMIWGINPVGLLASAGIVGIAVGFAAKDTLANLFSGVFILADRPYKLGDYVNLESGERGKVTNIGIRSTRLLTRDDIEITIPNGVIGNAKIVNENGGAQHKMRIRVNVQCAYNSNLEKVEKVLNDVAVQDENICAYPAPRVRYKTFGDSGINLQLTGWIEEPEIRGRTIHGLIKAIHRAFDEHSIEIPYPHMQMIQASDEDAGRIYGDKN